MQEPKRTACRTAEASPGSQAEPPNSRTGPEKPLGRSLAALAERSGLWVPTPNVPALAEVFPGYAAANWYGFLAPAKTPSPALEKLHKGMFTALQDKEMRDMLATEDCEIVASTPQAFTAFMKAEIAKWGKLIKEAKIKP